MSVDYAAFTDKYQQFANLNPDRFQVFLADALTEINQNQWGDSKDRATEMLLGHFLSISDPSDRMATPLESFRIDDKGYEVRYREGTTDYSSTVFGKEYERMLKQLKVAIAASQVAATSQFFHGVRRNSRPQCW